MILHAPQGSVGGGASKLEGGCRETQCTTGDDGEDDDDDDDDDDGDDDDDYDDDSVPTFTHFPEIQPVVTKAG